MVVVFLEICNLTLIVVVDGAAVDLSGLVLCEEGS